jgi:hypothetical protein
MRTSRCFGRQNTCGAIPGRFHFSARAVGGIKDATQTVIGLPVHAFRLVWELVEHADVPRLHPHPLSRYAPGPTPCRVPSCEDQHVEAADRLGTCSRVLRVCVVWEGDDKSPPPAPGQEDEGMARFYGVVSGNTGLQTVAASWQESTFDCTNLTALTFTGGIEW